LLESYSATTPHEPPFKKNSNIKINKNTGTQQTAPTPSPKLSPVSEILILVLLVLLLQDLSSKTGSIFHKQTKESFNLQVFVSSKCRKKGKSHDPINRGSRRMEAEAQTPHADGGYKQTLY
jgi:hypothetical protein